MPLETLEALESYDISAERGFLCGYDAEAVELTGDWVQARDVAMRLPQMLTTGKVRRLLRENLPDLTEADVAALSEVQARAAMVHYSFMVHLISGAKRRLMRFCLHVWPVRCVHWLMFSVSSHYAPS